ncbi:hypothetical protein [Nesterenkonia muleiensis]|uniref:hypothetical protein n=1 Tax=Nesterenkonia muleiensis TaxID=2282648 RepID=UPI000E73EE87|nr:hypothetical protein [Nesterenkonia muleiensis]
MLLAQKVAFDEHHFRLIGSTDFSAPDGELSLLHASTAMSRTSLALIASGRMKPDGGEVRYEENDDADPGQDRRAAGLLRRRTALVDAPGITAPEHHMTVRQVVSESLALRPMTAQTPGRPGSRRRLRAQVRSMDWLESHGLNQLARQKVVALEAETRLRLLIELAFADPAVRCAVVDSPDRHRIASHELLRLLKSLTGADRQRAILAVLGRVPEGAEALAGTISFANEAGGRPGAADEPADDDEEREDLAALGRMMEEDR